MQRLNIIKITTFLIFFVSTFLFSQSEIFKTNAFYNLSLSVNVDTSDIITTKNELNTLENELKQTSKQNIEDYESILKDILFTSSKINKHDFPSEYLEIINKSNDFYLKQTYYFSLYLFSNNFPKADSVFNKLENNYTLDKEKSFAYYYRFHQKMMQKEYKNAQKNLTQYLINAGTFYQMDTVCLSYAQIWQYLLDIKLSPFYKTSHSNVIEIDKNWKSLLTNYMLNKIDESEVLSFINKENNNKKKREFLTEILFYMALEYKFSNKESESLKYLKEVVRLKIYDFIEYNHAFYLLKHN